uniref:Glutathione S-transferase sigma 2 n=2 Tax=Brachionus TaxID=10194 RepID=A0A0A7DNG6_9BILA|nr:glutathione S-transferase sigma 2 [Brachionus koreanus]
MKNYKLNYFDFTGRAELLRLIFAVSNTPFTDQRIKFKDWKNEKKNAPLEQLPYLEVDDNQILVQSMAIARYLATEMNLTGTDTYEQVKVDLVLDLCKEFTDCFSIYVVPEMLYPTDEKEEIIQHFIDTLALRYLKNIEILIENFGQNNYAVGDQLTVADLFIHDLVTNMMKLKSAILENYPKLKKHRSQVEENENLKFYLETRDRIKLE